MMSLWSYIVGGERITSLEFSQVIFPFGDFEQEIADELRYSHLY